MGPMRGQPDALAGGIGHLRGDAGTARELDDDEAVVPELPRASAWPSSQRVRRYAIELLAIGVAYFAFAKLGLALASIHPSATPIWPPTGLALAAVMLWGYRICPAILVSAWAANVTTAGSVYTSSAIALGNTLESVAGAYLISRCSSGLRTFDTPAGVARFVTIAALAATPISATIGVGSLTLAGFADGASLGSTWMTWWLGDLAGALVVTPVVVLWATSRLGRFKREQSLHTGAVFAAAIAVGIIAFSPLIAQSVSRAPLGFLAILPLLWAALRCDQRDTATVALLLSCFAVWGTMAEQGSFARGTLNESFLVLLMFMISTTVPSLALSADVAVRKRTEQSLRQAHARLDRTVQERTAALEEARQALHQAQKMEALGQLTGGIAHDFNNILTVITSSLEGLRTSVSAAGQAPQRVDRALEAARNGASLIQQMLVFARRHPLQLTPSDANAIVTASLRMFTRSCPATIKVHTDLTSDLCPVLADPTQLQTAILNLAVNARDAMPSGGILTISTSLSSADYVCITVSDTGSGMTPEILARAFEPFFTTKEIGKGTGLGLSMVHSATRQMGGEAAIESRPGAGTTIRLLLPAAAVASSDEARHAELAPTVLRTQAEPTSVLYVEDNPLVSFATVDLLKDAGYAVHTAPEAERALALLDKHPEIELLVTDIGLPGMNGDDLAAEARRRRPDLKVLFVSGYDRTRSTAEPAEGPYTRYLEKPYQERDLCEALRQLSGAGESDAGQALHRRVDIS